MYKYLFILFQQKYTMCCAQIEVQKDFTNNSLTMLTIP